MPTKCRESTIAPATAVTYDCAEEQCATCNPFTRAEVEAVLRAIRQRQLGLPNVRGMRRLPGVCDGMTATLG